MEAGVDAALDVRLPGGEAPGDDERDVELLAVDGGELDVDAQGGAGDGGAPEAGHAAEGHGRVSWGEVRETGFMRAV